ncbi:hypothetical protein J14TS2_37060 [Bacillus sp. J14TS2]|uniref:YveK family protein n=1 Tax=Bacillus sp. J14TS2 TaxID=2807188 RepID=UPI001B213AEE|nr:Wzz/FepE/Etk N-terminal domain-containing protein [Bacillus sp. J14TS2]GIN73231.1 hypothetical protein J14TS2_37060 [Bacillus sp. J14TS2]
MDKFGQMHSADRRIAKEINIKELLRVIKRRFWIILIITFLTTMAGWFYSSQNKTAPLYETSTNIIIDANSEYRNTLQVIIKDTIVLESVINELGLDRSAKTLAGQIEVTNIEGSQVVEISVTDANPQTAADIANTTAKVFKKEIPSIIEFEDIRILSEAKANPVPVSQDNQNKLLVVAFISGIIVGLGLIFLLDSLDDSIKSEHDVESILGIQVLGSISKMSKKNVRKKKNMRMVLKIRGDSIGSK